MSEMMMTEWDYLPSSVRVLANSIARMKRLWNEADDITRQALWGAVMYDVKRVAGRVDPEPEPASFAAQLAASQAAVAELLELLDQHQRETELHQHEAALGREVMWEIEQHGDPYLMGVRARVAMGDGFTQGAAPPPPTLLPVICYKIKPHEPHDWVYSQGVVYWCSGVK